MAQRTWLITGVNSGFGRLMTEKLLERGDRVAGTARKLEQMDDVLARYGDRLWLAHLDLTETAAIRRTVDAAFAHFGAGGCGCQQRGIWAVWGSGGADGRAD